MRILAISGSLRAASYNTALLRAAADLAPEGVEVELFGGLAALPPYNEDHDTEDPHAEVTRLRDEIGSADAVLVATPEYNGTLPGQLKQVVDWASRPHGRECSLWGKPVAVIGASVTDYGAVWAQDHLRKAFGLAGARVVDEELAVTRVPERFGPDGELTDQKTRDCLARILGELAAKSQLVAAAA